MAQLHWVITQFLGVKPLPNYIDPQISLLMKAFYLVINQKYCIIVTLLYISFFFIIFKYILTFGFLGRSNCFLGAPMAERRVMGVFTTTHLCMERHMALQIGASKQICRLGHPTLPAVFQRVQAGCMVRAVVSSVLLVHVQDRAEIRLGAV